MIEILFLFCYFCVWPPWAEAFSRPDAQSFNHTTVCYHYRYSVFFLLLCIFLVLHISHHHTFVIVCLLCLQHVFPDGTVQPAEENVFRDENHRYDHSHCTHRYYVFLFLLLVELSCVAHTFYPSSHVALRCAQDWHSRSVVSTNGARNQMAPACVYRMMKWDGQQSSRISRP